MPGQQLVPGLTKHSSAATETIVLVEWLPSGLGSFQTGVLSVGNVASSHKAPVS